MREINAISDGRMALDELARWHLETLAKETERLNQTAADSRAQLDDALVRNAKEQDNHNAERCVLMKERDEALAFLFSSSRKTNPQPNIVNE